MAFSKSKYINRELSWLEFNQRILDEACDPAVPLLERLKFLAITASNLSEFFMVRVGGLSMLASQSIVDQDPSGLTPSRQLEAISRRVHTMVEAQYHCYFTELVPLLEKNGIRCCCFSELSDISRTYLENTFRNEIYPLVTPLAVHTESDYVSHSLANLGLYLLVRLKPETDKITPRFAFLPIHGNLPRIVPVPGEEGFQYVWVDDLIKSSVQMFFPGEEIAESFCFRITRNADINLQDEFTADLLAEMEKVLIQRKYSDCIRLEIEEGASVVSQAFLKSFLNINESYIYRISGPIQLFDLMQIAGMDGYENLKYEAWLPQPTPGLEQDRSMFQALSRKNMILYHPYESFDPVVRLLNEAADDQDVIAIKQILYRVSRKSPIVGALSRAALNGKYVTAVVELKARFDEARNIDWAKQLERDGVQVIYGEKGLKTHAKATIIVRREHSGIVRYMHFGTGNYNENTARLYSDVSYLTSDEDLASDTSAFFNAVTGYSQLGNFKKLCAAPLGLRENIVELIENETERKQHGQKALIMAKMNSLVDKEIIDTLYRASIAGVKVMLNIRGICCLKPGVAGLSENISVISIVGRFLEHSRIFYFYHGGEEKMFISSADWMARNLNRRVELMVPIEDTAGKKKLKRILETHFKDTSKAKELRQDGTYESVKPGGRSLSSQKALYQFAKDSFRSAQRRKRTVFEPHTPPGESI